MSKQIRNMENNIFNVELAMDSAPTRKEQDELSRKRNKFKKKLKKMKRKAGRRDSENTSYIDNKDWI